MPDAFAIDLPDTSLLLPQQQCEVRFWHQLALSFPTRDDFIAFRRAELDDKTRHFHPYWSSQEGLGLEIGCGCVSVLGSSGKDFISIDPLAPFYEAISGLHCRNASAENLPFPSGMFDWLFCVNMIDHTPDPKLALKEMRRVLRPTGYLYFEVNFDDFLYAEHFERWDRALTDSRLLEAGFSLVKEHTERLPEHSQSRFWGVYEPIL